MSTYLIDFENVKSGGLAGIDHIRKEDSVHLFWSVRENKISIEMMELIRSSESEIVMHKAVTGERDALDHQLCSYLGYLAGGKGETDFVIVSNDKAYDHLIEFWRKMNNEVHIRRVSEIAGVSEILPANVEAVLPAVAEEKAVQTDKAENAVLEAVHAVSDTYVSRNSRRRERGGKYLKGGKTGRIARKNIHSEEYQEEERTADRVRETATDRITEAAEQKEKRAAEYTADNSPVEKQAEPRRDSAAAYVVTGIKTGILVESGFTADGILDNRNNSEVSRKRDDIKTGSEKPNGPVEEKTADKQAEAPVRKETADKQTEIPVKKETVDKQTENSVKTEAADEQAEAPVKKEVADKQAEAPVKKEVSDKQAEAPVKKESADKQTEKPVREKTIAVRQAEEPVSENATDKQPEKAERAADKQTGEKAEDTVQPPSVETEADVQEKNEAEKKLRTRTARTSARSKRGRPSKKDRTEYLPEIKLPIIKSDVVAKCEEAADAEWTDEVVRLINESKDKKELYSAIVRLLGQEKGRMVYHEIKILK